MANSDYTIKPQGYGFCPMAFMAADIDELDTSITITGYSSSIENGIQIGKAALLTNVTAGDSNFANVSLLVQGGSNGSMVVQDQSSYGGSVTITDFAAFDSARTVFDANMIGMNRISAGSPSFVSTGAASRFGREVGSKFTIECYVFIVATENYTTSSFFFSWVRNTDRIIEVGTFGNGSTGGLKLRVRSGETPEINTFPLSYNTLHFIQLNVDGNAMTIDVDGVEAYAFANGNGEGSDGEWGFKVAASTVGALDTAPTTSVFVTPLRFTKGILRPRGSVPTEPFNASTVIRQEIVKVAGQTGDVLTVARGCCDTIPQPFSTGDGVWFFDDSIAMDSAEYAGTETIGVKLQPRLSSGAGVPLEYISPHRLTFGLRFARPYPPGLVEVDGNPWFDPQNLSSAHDELVVTWAHRDRVTQQDQLIDHLQASIGPEVGTTYEIELRKAGTTIRTVVGLAAETFTYTFEAALTDFFASAAIQAGDYPGTMVLRSMRDGLESFQEYVIDFTLHVEDGDGLTAPAGTWPVLQIEVDLVPERIPTSTIAMVALQQAKAAKPASGWHSTVELMGSGSIVGVGALLTAQFDRWYTIEGQLFGESVQAGFQMPSAVTRATALAAWAGVVNFQPVLQSYGWQAVQVGTDPNIRYELYGPVGQEWSVTPTPSGTPPNSILFGLLQTIHDRGGPAVLTSTNQIVTATIGGTITTGDLFLITLDATPYSVVALSGATASSIATALAALIDANPDYTATAVGPVITIEKTTPVAFFYFGQTKAATAYSS